MGKKSMLITGASRGIGRATAKQALEQGYDVLNLSRKEPDLEGVVHIETDLADPQFIDRIAEPLSAFLSERQSSPLTVVHNAGLLLKDSINSIDANDFARVLQINVIAASQINKYLLPTMAEGSSILYIGSTLSEKGVPGTCSYVVSKHAVLGLMRATCQDLVGAGVHTACICPGFTETEMLTEHVGGDKAIFEDIAKGIVMQRMIQPEEIANTLLFAAENPVLNGAVLHANLGQIEV